MDTLAKLAITSCQTLKLSGPCWLLGDLAILNILPFLVENVIQLQGSLVQYFRGITTGQGMCDLMLQEAKVMLIADGKNNKIFNLLLRLL